MVRCDASADHGANGLATEYGTPTDAAARSLNSRSRPSSRECVMTALIALVIE
jgi:hypothetical protein